MQRKQSGYFRLRIGGIPKSTQINLKAEDKFLESLDFYTTMLYNIDKENGLVERPGSTCGWDVPCLYGDFRQNRVVMDHVMWSYMAYSRRRNDIVEVIVDE